MTNHIYEVVHVTFVEKSSGWNGRWKNIYKKIMNIISVPSQRYQDSRHLLQNPKVPRSIMGFSNHTHRFTGSNYLDLDSPLKNILSCDRWHVTRYTWHVIHDTWHMTHSVGWTFSKNFSSLALPDWDWQCLEDIWSKGSLTHLINQWMIYKAVYRTAPATPVLLNGRGRPLLITDPPLNNFTTLSKKK